MFFNGGNMNIVKKGEHLACVKHVGGTTRIYLTGKNRQKKKIVNDDSFFVAIPFSEENSYALCKLIAESQGMHAVPAGQGMGGSFLFDLK